MKSILKKICLSGVAFISLSFLTAAAAPLPGGTMLGITGGVGSAPNFPCATGSCFGMEVAPGFTGWTDIISPGTDGGFIVGKAQKCGTQESGPSADNTSPSELTAAWLFFGNYGTFCTDPGGEQNIFNDASCTGAGCIGKTELKYFYAVWNGNKIPLGSSVGCAHTSCSADQLAGIFVADYLFDPALSTIWSLKYNQVVPSGSFLGVRFGMVVRGPVPPPCGVCPPLAGNINLETSMSTLVVWMPVVSSSHGNPPTCRIGTAPANGTATVATNCSSGTYQSDMGFIGIDSFTYIANNGSVDSDPGTVTVAVGDIHPTPTYTPTATSSGTPTLTPSPLCTPNPPLPSLVLTTTPDQPVSWDVARYGASGCSIVRPPSYGTVTVSNCAGVYTPNSGFVGQDSFVYHGFSTSGSCPAQYDATITINVCPAGGCAAPTPTPRPCAADYPVTQVNSLGKQGTLSITFTGNIVSSTNKEIKICPGTTLSYSASSSKDVVKCKVKNSLTSGSGTLRIRDHLKCTDKPGGKDKVQFKVKSGVTK